MMQRRFGLAALLLTPLLMAQTQPPETVAYGGAPVLIPQAVEFNPEVQTATGTAVLLTQQANVAFAVRVDAPVAGSIPIGNASISLSIAPGTELFPVALNERRGIRAFCTVQTQSTVYTPIRPPIITRTCLADGNADRVFDHLAYMRVDVTPTRAVNGSWQTPPAPHVSGGIVTIAVSPIPSPVPYTPLQQHNIAPLSLEVTARVIGETASLELRSHEGDASALFQRHDNVLAARMPRVANIYGAQVELQSLAAGTLTYRVVRAFPTDQPLSQRDGPLPMD